MPTPVVPTNAFSETGRYELRRSFDGVVETNPFVTLNNSFVINSQDSTFRHYTTDTQRGTVKVLDSVATSRTITLSGMVFAANRVEADALLSEIKSANSYPVIRLTDTSLNRYIEGKADVVITPVSPKENILNVSIIINAFDPHWYANNLTTIAYTGYPTTFNVPGDQNPFPIITLEGPLSFVRVLLFFLNTSLNKGFTIKSVPDGQTAIVNCGEQTITGIADPYNALLESVSADFYKGFFLEVGSSRIGVQESSSVLASFKQNQVSLQFRSKWL